MNDSNATAELQAFRNEWKNELAKRTISECKVQAAQKEDQAASTSDSQSHSVLTDSQTAANTSYDEAPFPFQFTDSLLRSWQESPPAQSQREKRQSESNKSVESGKPLEKKQRRSLLDVYIDDLNELDDVPFFDVSLPREIAVKIFSFLDINDLCACSQVSKAWAGIADDNLLWERLYLRLQATFTGQASVCESVNWKETVRECYVSTRTLLMNWKEHKCHITYYHHAMGGILTSVHSAGDLIVAGYTNGQVKSWNITNQDTLTFEASNKSLQLLREDDEDVLGMSENSVTCVRLGHNDTILAGYKHGQLQTWRQADPDTMMVMEFAGQSVKEVMASGDVGYVQLNSLNGSGCHVKVIMLSENSLEISDSLVIRGDDQQWTLPKQLMVPLPIQSADTTPLVYLTRDSINIHKTTHDAYTSRHYSSSSQLEEFYAIHFTCLEASQRYVNLGFTSHLGLQAEYKVRQYDTGTLKHCTDLRGHTSHVTCIDSSYPSGYMVCTGCHDRRVRLYDVRLPTYAVHTYMGHPDAVQCIQADDWKIVSGDLEGYIYVWDQRMANKFWESQSRHPVRYLSFAPSYLISANIPQQTDEERFDCDRMTHLRYRGRLQLSDFSVDHSTAGIPSICSSSYDVPEASNYNISLITPYDSI